MISDNSSPLSLLTVLNPGGSSNIGGNKPPKSIDEMIAIMRCRGLVITDERRLRDMLLNENYYRLSGYFRVYQNDPSNGDNMFRDGTRDTDFIVPYQLDEQLRSIVLKGTARVELTLRSRFAYYLAQDGNAYNYLDQDSYEDVVTRKGVRLRQTLITNMHDWINRSKEVCIKHYKDKGKDIPVWAAVETLPFDTLSRMLSLHTDTTALRRLYKSVGLKAGLRKSSEIVHSMVYLRNICSHHCRLWHREMVISPPEIRDIANAFPRFNDIAGRSVASSLMTLMYLVTGIEGSHEYADELTRFITQDYEYYNGIITPLHWE